MSLSSAFLQQIPTETMQVLLASVVAPDPGDLCPSFLSCRDVVELQGPSGSGKSQFIYYMLITCILPATYESRRLGGWGKAAFLLDADLAFDISRLKHLMLSRLNPLLQSLALPSHHSHIIMNLSLKRLHVFRPNSSSQLAVTLLYIPSYIASHLPNTEMGMIAVDSLSSFYWADRFIVEQGRAKPRTSPAHASMYAMHNIAFALERIKSSFFPLVLLANWGLDYVHSPGASTSSSPRRFKQHLHPFPSPFASDEKQASADKQSTVTSPLTLTAQVTFFPAPHHANEEENLPMPAASSSSSGRPDQDPSTTQVNCLIRRHARDPEKFRLDLTHGSVRVASC